MKLPVGSYWKLHFGNYGILMALDYQSGHLKTLLQEGVSGSSHGELEVMSFQVPPSASEHPMHKTWIPEVSNNPQDIAA